MLHLEDAPNYLFDMTGMRGHKDLRTELVVAVAAHCSHAEGWRRVKSVRGGQRGLSAFLRWTELWNAEHADSEVTGVAHLTPFHVRTFRQYMAGEAETPEAKALRPSTAETYYKALRAILPRCRDLPNETRRELGKRFGAVGAQTRMERYPTDEFTSIKNAARRVFLAAHSRISQSHQEALGHGRDGVADGPRARALYEVLTTGEPSDRAGYEALGALSRRGWMSVNQTRRWLFLSQDELLAAAVLLACQRGLNLAPIIQATTPYVHEPGIVQLDLDKPRRGPSARFWPEIISDADVSDDGGERNATVVELIAAATEPARTYLAHSGRPSMRLFVRWPDFSVKPLEGIGTRRTAAWLPKQQRVHFSRLRRSVPGAGVAKEPTDHDATAYLHYVRTDPDSLLERQEEAAHGIQDAMDRARVEVHLRLVSDTQAPMGNDALIVNCENPEHHPVTGRPCTSAFFSPFDCLDCDNAATARRFLPAQLASIQVLDELRGAMDTMWEKRFARRYYQLQTVVSRHSAAEREEAAARVQDHIPTILAALRQQVPR